jgi:MFS family permease
VTGAWAALAILFTVRLAMAFQYQTAAALGPLVMERHGVGIADLGILVAIYLSPGIAVALPGGAIAKRFGDRRIVTLGLLMMVAGGVVMWRSPKPGRCRSRRPPALAGAGGLGLFLTTYRDPPGRAWRLPRVAAGRATCGWSPPCSPARSGASVTARSRWSLPLGRRF